MAHSSSRFIVSAIYGLYIMHGAHDGRHQGSPTITKPKYSLSLMFAPDTFLEDLLNLSLLSKRSGYSRATSSSLLWSMTVLVRHHLLLLHFHLFHLFIFFI